jgi:hypothetical protein
MAKLPISNDPKSTAANARRGGGNPRTPLGGAAASAMSVKWTAVHDAAAAVGELAGEPPEFRTPEVHNFPAIMRDAGGWRFIVAQEGVDDLAAIMEPGLTALLALHGRGVPTLAPAQALWHEFQSARAALLALIPPLGV